MSINDDSIDRIISNMETEQYDTACMQIKELIVMEPDSYILYYLRALCEIHLDMHIEAFFDLHLAQVLCSDKQEQQEIFAQLHQCGDITSAPAYQVAHVCQQFVEACMENEQYEIAQRFLAAFLFSPDKQLFQIVSSEENMGLYLMLEIVLCEKKNVSNNQHSIGIKQQFGNNVNQFLKVYTPLKHIIRRIWFGFDKIQQQEIITYMVKHHLSADFLAVAVKYSTLESYWQDITRRILLLLDEVAHEDDTITEIMENLFVYYQWFVQNKIGGGSQVIEPYELDNGAESIHLEYTSVYKQKQVTSLDEHSIDVIYCTNDQWYSQECERYIRRLPLDPGMKLHIYAVWNAPSMAAGYNCAMKQSQAKYKIYIHHDSFLLYPNMITDLIQAFHEDTQMGMIGIAGTTHLGGDAYWWTSDKRDMRMQLYQDYIMTIYESHSIEKHGKVERVEALDGYFLATQYDCDWREDLFDHWHFYDIGQCYEFQRSKYHIGVMNLEEMWMLHEPTMKKDPKNYYEHYRDIFVEEYFN